MTQCNYLEPDGRDVYDNEIFQDREEHKPGGAGYLCSVSVDEFRDGIYSKYKYSGIYDERYDSDRLYRKRRQCRNS